VTGLLSPEAVDFGDPRIQQLQAVAARKGVTLDLRPLRSATHNPTVEQIALEVGCEVGQVVSSSLCVAPLPRGLSRPIVCMTAGCGEIAIELLAAVTGEVEVRVATAREARDLFNCLPGLVPAFGHGRGRLGRHGSGPRRLPVGLGTNGLGLRGLPDFPSTLRMLSNATVAPVVTTSRARSVEGFDGAAVPRIRGGLADLVGCEREA